MRCTMPFKEISIAEVIQHKHASDPIFKQAWEMSRNEYELLFAIASLRKEHHLTQQDLAELTGSSQQEISRLENRSHSPALRTLCRIVNALGYDLVLKERTISASDTP